MTHPFNSGSQTARKVPPERGCLNAIKLRINPYMQGVGVFLALQNATKVGNNVAGPLQKNVFRLNGIEGMPRVCPMPLSFFRGGKTLA
ncbi:MAG: hypothetical protein DRR08_18845 [Candidatus Parabeggiatoa sp. nov. 2]|nr:MAG: hypothetical protein B6247_24095 [Beggiatoa sp. 4572_84]RKZ57488.1 MAG: hypothetical protein DRR08_18845 [Gammaproteobacteria bacterium]